MVLAQRQKCRSMEQNRKPRDKSMHIWTPSCFFEVYIYLKCIHHYSKFQTLNRNNIKHSKNGDNDNNVDQIYESCNGGNIK